MKPDDGNAANSYELDQKFVLILDSEKVRLISTYILLDYHFLALPCFGNHFTQGLLMSFPVSTTRCFA